MSTTVDAGTHSEQQVQRAIASEPGRSRRSPWGFIAWVIGLLFVSPVLWMIFLSFHSEQDASSNPPKFTAPLTVSGYRDFFGGGQSPWPSLANSATASICSTILVLLLAIPAAYALSIRPVRKWTDVLSSSSPPRCCPRWPVCCRST